MIKKPLCIILIPLILFSCGKITRMIKASNNEEYHYKQNGVEEFSLHNNTITISTNINGSRRPLYFDTRAVSVLFSNPANHWIDSLPVIAEFGALKSANDEKVENYVCAIEQFETELFSINNKLARVISWPDACNQKVGIMGMDVFDQERKIVNIDFDTQTIKLLPFVDINAGWKEIESKFNNGYIKIVLTLNNKEETFGLDTGFSGSLLIKETGKNKDFIGSLGLDQVNYGILFQSAHGSVYDSVTTKWVDVVKANNEFFTDSVKINISNTIKNNLVGLGFLKYANLILDYKNKKVFFQPRKTKITRGHSILSRLGAGFYIVDQKLVLAYLTQSKTAESAGLRINDEILELNGVKLDEIPVCDKKHILEDELIINTLNTILVKRDSLILEKQFDL